MVRSIGKCLAVILVIVLRADGQDLLPTAADRHIIDSVEAHHSIIIPLSRSFVVRSSITVFVRGTAVVANYDGGTNAVVIGAASFDGSTGDTVSVSYQYIPLQLRPTYRLRSLVFDTESHGRRTPPAIVSRSEDVLSTMFGPELSKSGSITRGFTIGTNQDLTLSSGFRLQLAGKLSSDIDILAALTDENTPIQPQGNTQALRDIDNVFVEIRSPVYTATLGDFQYLSNRSEFVAVSRKLQGARIEASYQEIGAGTQASVIGASSRGKFSTARLQGIEGVQGPYRLTGKNGERDIIVIAGTEKVFIDGEAMVRGENNDYSIDYGSAEITFSTRRLITGASRIVVDFEYTDRQYTRNFLGGSVSSKVSHDVSVTAQYYREADNQDEPIDIALDDSDRSVLQQAGDAPAVRTGVVFVGTDSLGVGKGYYAAVDTAVAGVPYRYYQYAPSTVDAQYAVTFSFIGAGKGDYHREGPGRYAFAGVGGGEYAPVIILPKPQLYQLFSVQSSASVAKDFTVNGEFAATGFDQNRFSKIGDDGNNGNAFMLSMRYAPSSVSVAGLRIGSMDISAMERYKDSRFSIADRIDDVEFGRKWSTDSILSATATSEELRSGTVIYRPTPAVMLGSSYGTLEKGSTFSSDRYDVTVEANDSLLPSLSYYAENVSGADDITAVGTAWFRQKGTVRYSIGQFVPSFHAEQEKRRVTDRQTDSLRSPSYAFDLLAPKLEAISFYGLDVSTGFEWRYDRAYSNGEVVPQSTSRTQSYSIVVKEVKNFSLSSAVTLRDRSYTREFQSLFTNQRSTLVKLQSRYRPFDHGLDIDALYDASSQRTAKLERYFFKVRRGEGQYVWVDANGNGVADLDDEREFVQDRYDGEYVALTVNSTEFTPVVSVKASSRVKITPSRFFDDRSAPIASVLSAISGETYLRLEERNTSSRTEDIYFLNLSRFLDPATTLFGSQFLQQDLFLFENDPEYSFRIRFNQRKGLSQFATGGERNYARERSIRSRIQLMADVNNQSDAAVKDDNALSASGINQQRQIRTMLFATDFSYRPERSLELGIKIESSVAEDRGQTAPVTASLNTQTVRTVLGFLGNGQIRMDAAREELMISGIAGNYSIPFELTSGRETGIHFVWNVSSEYRLGGNVQFSLLYSGRTTSRVGTIHTGRMEVRAFF